MLQIRVFLDNISAQRFWGIEKSIPPVKINTSLNILTVEKRGENFLEIPFVFTVNYDPAVAQVNLRGKSHVLGSKNELTEIYSAYESKKPPPPTLVQSISNVVFVESITICRSLNIPLPIPLPKIPSAQNKRQRHLVGLN